MMLVPRGTIAFFWNLYTTLLGAIAIGVWMFWGDPVWWRHPFWAPATAVAFITMSYVVIPWPLGQTFAHLFFPYTGPAGGSKNQVITGAASFNEDPTQLGLGGVLAAFNFRLAAGARVVPLAGGGGLLRVNARVFS